jgi:Leucine-rich repeat (LRR) protein
LKPVVNKARKMHCFVRLEIINMAMCRLPMGLVSMVGISSLMAPILASAADDPTEVEKSIAEIKKLGGKTERDEKAEGKPVTLVNFATTPVEDPALALVKPFGQLKKLTLNGTKVTDAGLEHLKDCKSIEKLYLVDTKIGDSGLEQLKGLTNLKVLSLAGTQVSDEGLEHLKGLENLQELFLYGSKVTDEGVKKLKEARSNLKIDR